MFGFSPSLLSIAAWLFFFGRLFLWYVFFFGMCRRQLLCRPTLHQQNNMWKKTSHRCVLFFLLLVIHSCEEHSNAHNTMLKCICSISKTMIQWCCVASLFMSTPAVIDYLSVNWTHRQTKGKCSLMRWGGVLWNSLRRRTKQPERSKRTNRKRQEW